MSDNKRKRDEINGPDRTIAFTDSLVANADEGARIDHQLQLKRNAVAQELLNFLKEQRSRVKTGESLYEKLRSDIDFFDDVDLVWDHIVLDKKSKAHQAFYFLSCCGSLREPNWRRDARMETFCSLLLLSIKSTAELEAGFKRYADAWDDETKEGDSQSEKKIWKLLSDNEQWVEFEEVFQNLTKEGNLRYSTWSH